MSYEEAIIELRSNHFYPNLMLQNNIVEGLYVNSPPILMEDRVKKISEILGNAFSVIPMTNLDYIMITKK